MKRINILFQDSKIFSCRAPSYTEGIFQSIGFKEFHEYLILPYDDKKTQKGQKIFEKGISF